MRYPFCSRLSFLLTGIFIGHFLFAQDCKVEKESISGSYTGDCKRGKANGKGKAVGIDTYEGEFRSGVPDGEGTYTWSNGDRYSGKFEKGLRDGKGTLVYKRKDATDSVVDGYWKKDQYIGKHEKPYKIYFSSKSLTQTDVEYKKDLFDQITFFVSNTSGGTIEVSGEKPVMKIDDIFMITGSYATIRTDNNHVKKTETVIAGVLFPARMKVNIGQEQLEIEFYERGSYVINIKINQ